MKKKWSLRMLSLMLSCVLVAGMLAGCRANQDDKPSENQGKTEAGTKGTEGETEGETEGADEIVYPLEGDVKLSIFVHSGAGVHASFASVDEAPWHNALEKKTGVDIDWQFPAAGADINTALSLLWQDDKLPNIVTGACGTMSNLITWYEDGLIYDLTEYLPKYAPDYWAYLNLPENAEEKMKVQTDDGKFLAVHSFLEKEEINTYLGPVIRQDWLDECGLKAPQTLEEWENVLVKFKEKYNAKFGFFMSRFNTGSGIASGTGAYAALKTNFYLDENNKVCLGNTGEEWKELLEVLNRWYNMGLLDPDFATVNDAALRTKVANNEIGVAYTAVSQLQNWMVDAETSGTGAKWVGFQYPATEVGAAITYSNISRGKLTNYSACITTDSSEEELIAALKMLNYGYTEEGLLFHNLGEEGIGYVKDAQGNIAYGDTILNDPDGIDAAVKKYSNAHTGMMSTIQLQVAADLKRVGVAADAVAKWTENNDAKKHVIPAVTYTTDENTEMAELDSALSTYIVEWALKFVTGQESLDKYSEYEAGLERYNLKKSLEIKQAAVDRYFNR